MGDPVDGSILFSRRFSETRRSHEELVSEENPSLLRRLREEAGVSTKELGQRIGVGTEMVRHIESSEADGTLRLSMLNRVANALGHTLRYDLVPQPIDENQALSGEDRGFIVDQVLDRAKALRRIELLDPIKQGDAALEPSRRRLSVGSKWTVLTPAEYLLAHALLSAGGQPVSRQRLIEAIWEHDAPERWAALRVLVIKIRDKLEESGLPRATLSTMRGVGYFFDHDVGTGKEVGDDAGENS